MVNDMKDLIPDRKKVNPSGAEQKAIPAEIHRGRSQWRLATERYLRNKPAIFGLIMLFLLICSAIFAPLLATYDPTSIDYGYVRKPPSAEHIFGTDNLGRDIFSRVLWGGRDSLRVGMVAVLISIVGGVLLGLFSAFAGGFVDNLIQRFVDLTFAFPTILLLLSIVAALGPNLTTVLIAIGISGIPGYSRLMRGSVLQALNTEYVLAARLVGAGNLRLMFRHILPNVLTPIIIYGTLGLGGGIMVTAGLSYLGLGAQPPAPEWGAMLNEGRTYLQSAPWMSIYPGLAVFLAILSINLIGDGLRDALDPKFN
jgi:peptide/nickel transport system permease protein